MTIDDYINALRTEINGKQKVFHERLPKNLNINNYNPTLLMLNNSNMDFTFINDAFACVAYVLGYLTKDETQMSEALKNIDETVANNEDVKKKLHKFESVFDRCRECSFLSLSWMNVKSCGVFAF